MAAGVAWFLQREGISDKEPLEPLPRVVYGPATNGLRLGILLHEDFQLGRNRLFASLVVQSALTNTPIPARVPDNKYGLKISLVETNLGAKTIATTGMPAEDFLALNLHRSPPAVIRKMRYALLGGSGGLSGVNDLDLSEVFKHVKPGGYRLTAEQRLLVARPHEKQFRPLILLPVTVDVDLGN